MRAYSNSRSIFITITCAFISVACVSHVASAQEHPTSIHQLESEREARSASCDSMIHRMPQPAASSGATGSATTNNAPLRKRVFGWVPYWISQAAWSKFDWSALTAIGFFSLEVDTATGSARTLRGWSTTPLRDMARSNGVKLVLTVTLFGSAANTAVLSDPIRRTRLVATITDAIDSGAGDGVNIDCEAVSSTQRDNLVAFMSELATSVRAAVPGAEISMAVPAVDWSNAFDVVRLDAICDYLIVMGYDYHWSGAASAGPVAPLAGESCNVTRSLQSYLTRGSQPAKLMLGVPWYGYDWWTADSLRGSAALASGVAVIYSTTQSSATVYGRMFDAATSVPWYRYKIDNDWHQAWYDDSLSLALKYRYVNDNALGGIGIWALGYQGDAEDVWQGIHQAFDVPSATPATDATTTAGMTIANDALRITLPRATKVRVEIHDILGAHVATLVDAMLDAGVHVIPMNIDRTGSGVYVISGTDLPSRLYRRVD